MALVTTFATTPLTMWLYPTWYQKKLESWKKGLIDWDTGRSLSDNGDDVSVVAAKLESAKVKDLLVYLRLDSMPALLTFVSLLGGRPNDVRRIHPAKSGVSEEDNTAQITLPRRPVGVHGVRMMELTDRDSSVMQVSEAEEYSIRDPIINTFRNFGRLYNLFVSGEVVVAPEESFSELLAAQAARDGSDLLLIPWKEGSISESQLLVDATQSRHDSTSYTTFVIETLKAAPCNTAVLVNKGLGGSESEYRPSALHRRASAMSMRSHREKAAAPIPDRSHHIFMPYFGGADGRVALRLVLQLAENPDITVTVIYFAKPATFWDSDGSDTHERCGDVMDAGTSAQASKAGPRNTNGSTELRDRDSSFFDALQRSLPDDLASRVLLETVHSSTPVDDAIARAEIEVAQNPKNAGDLIVTGRHTALLIESSSANGSLGATADLFIERGLKASMLIVQARHRGGD